MVRPEALSIVPAEGAALIGRVESVNFVGDRQRVSIAGAADKPILVDAPNALGVAPGDTVGLQADASGVRLLGGDAP